jgi:hypothetical protein
MNTGNAIAAEFVIICKQSSKEREEEEDGTVRRVGEKGKLRE